MKIENEIKEFLAEVYDVLSSRSPEHMRIAMAIIEISKNGGDFSKYPQWSHEFLELLKQDKAEGNYHKGSKSQRREENDDDVAIQSCNGIVDLRLSPKRSRPVAGDGEPSSPPKQRKVNREETCDQEVLDIVQGWFPPLTKAERDEINNISNDWGHPSLGLYKGDENFQHVEAFVNEAIRAAKQSNEAVYLFFCSPYFQNSEKSRYTLPRSLKQVMNQILYAEENNLHCIFLSRKGEFQTVIRYLEAEQKKLLQTKLESGSLRVFDNLYPWREKKYSHSKWIAIVKSSDVELLHTSANFTDSHLLVEEESDGYQQLDSMERITISLAYFQIRFLIQVMQISKFELTNQITEQLMLDLKPPKACRRLVESLSQTPNERPVASRSNTVNATRHVDQSDDEDSDPRLIRSEGLSSNTKSDGATSCDEGDYSDNEMNGDSEEGSYTESDNEEGSSKMAAGGNQEDNCNTATENDNGNIGENEEEATSDESDAEEDSNMTSESDDGEIM